MAESKILNNAIAKVAGRELTVTRVFQAPREIVYQTWTDPRHLSHWWGPEGFTITIHEMDVRPGGVWSYVMHGPDGTDYINRIQYIEIVRPERLVYSHGDDEQDERFRVTVTMEDKGSATELTMRMVFPTVEELEETVNKYGAIEGAKSTLGRLAEELDAVKTTNLEITRTFHAPRDLVFKAWTDPEHLKHWWGPTGFDIHIATFDLQPGGLFHYSMQNADGHQMWGKFVFREVSGPNKLVFVNSFSDVEGNTVRAPFSELYPLEILNIVTFTEQDGQTTLTLQGGPIHASEEEVQFFYSMHPSMQQGFGGTFDQLDEYLAKL
ncbi:SRPBCC family protein [Brevibacillus sp. NRS-1366]|uniref:SRPBCC family protein n=1 Tax=Brevibacillus sp. NRS-1366 TaxID=3233899 RepID=UPI003D25BF68